MIKSIPNFLIILFIFQQLKSQISSIDQYGVNPFCNETLHIQMKRSNGEKKVQRPMHYFQTFNLL